MFFQLKLQEIVNFTEMHSSFIWAAHVKEETQNSGSEKPLFHGHRYRMPLCILGTQPSWSPERGARAMISGRWEHHVLFVSREGQSPHWHLLLSWVQREKDRRVLERDSFFKNTVYLFIFMCIYEGGSGRPMHVWSQKRASDLLEMELQAIIICPVWMTGAELEFSVRVAKILNRCSPG